MQAQSDAALDTEVLPSENGTTKDVDSSTPLSSPKDVGPQMPVKKPTRQWAAWTRQEEESFFNALRLVGKNFEKITSRVQSKNKDQVRHYYYRLLRRMKKLLGPGFSLDTKNTKDTISAMLRWWSLLEKHSCTSSKLRLKPRRFKIFVEALEHQLLKDRRKTQKKRPSSGENISTSASAVPLLTKTEGNDIPALRLVVVDGQNIQKVGSGKASPLKRSGNMNISCNKSDLSPVKISKQRRRTGSVSSAAYKRWEKAAIAGVSLVADAAEQLERTIADRDVNANQGISNVDDNQPLPPECHSFLSPVSDRVFSQNQIAQNCSQAPMKLKLQLFPIDEVTRRALEKDELNPHLELTLSSRKKIASVLEHLSHKWGNSSIASGELILFPYSLQQQSITADCQRWTFKDTTSTAADVYEAIGKPAVFRLRYGWFSDAEHKPQSHGMSSTSTHLDDCLPSNVMQGQECANVADGNTVSARPKPINQPSFPDSHDQRIQDILESDSPLGSGDAHPPSFRKEDEKGGVARKHSDDLDNMRLSNSSTLTAGEWADSLTNISIGELLLEASRGMDVNCIDPPVARSDSILHQIPFSSDSFDAAIAAHLSGSRATLASCTQMPHSSIWDAEETCDAFSFRKVSSINQEVSSPSPSTSFRACREICQSNSVGFHGLIEELAQIGEPEKPDKEEDMKGSHSDAQSEDDSSKNISLTDLYWPDSLGPLDLDISPRYQTQEMILGESVSLGGLSRLIASSLDAFQNCSFFGSDKIESPASGP